MEVGFIGLGSMGGALATRLAGRCTPRVSDLRAEAVEALVGLGARASDPADIAAHCDHVITCLPRTSDVRAVLTGPAGLAAALRPGSMLIDMTTGDPAADREFVELLTARDVHYVDAPVSGGPHGAAAGTLAIMVGAEPDDFARAAPLLRLISPHVVHAGPVGAGHTLKLANNLLAATNRLAAYEALAVAVAGGVELATAVATINQSSGRSQVTEVTFPRFLLDGEIRDQNFSIGLMLKDVRLAAAAAAATAVGLDLGLRTTDRFEQAVDRFGEATDINQVVRFHPGLAAAIDTGLRDEPPTDRGGNECA